MDDDDFGGFEAAETFECGDTNTQHTVSPTIPWAAFSTVPGMKLSHSAPPDVPLDQAAPPSVNLLSQPLHQPDTLPSVPVSSFQIQQQGLPVGCGDAPLAAAAEAPVASQEVSLSSAAQETQAQLQKTLSGLQVKLTATEEERAQIKKDLEELMEKQARIEEQYLKEKETEAESHRSRYAELQEKHKTGLEEMRKAGHEALTIIVEEFKALTKSAVLQQQETSEKCLEAAIEKQSQKCEQLLNAQHQRLIDLLDAEREALEEKLKETLSQQAQHHKEELEKCLLEEKQKTQEAIEAALQAEKERVKEAVLEAVRLEQQRLEEKHATDKGVWEEERRKDREMVAQAIQEALQEERKRSKEAMKAAIEEEQQAGERRIGEAVGKAREELMDYVKEQKRLDQLTRQRNLASLELFLACAQKQLAGLLEDRPVGAEQTQASTLKQ
ncbi:coiled-coil domain-containing protein 91 isoform X2 [Amia ocellicauda]